MKNSKKFILFDNDGILVDTEAWYFEANKKALSLLGLKLEMDFYQEVMVSGRSAFELAEIHNIDKNIIEKHRDLRNKYYQEFLKTKELAIPNVKKVLNELAKRYKMAIITTSRRVDFELIHKNRGITDFMNFVLCVEDYKRAKPDPEPYLKGLEKFNAINYEAIVVEDSQRGLQSAKSANLDCIVIKNHFTANQDFSKADFFLNSFEDLQNLLL